MNDMMVAMQCHEDDSDSCRISRREAGGIPEPNAESGACDAPELWLLAELAEGRCLP